LKTRAPAQAAQNGTPGRLDAVEAGTVPEGVMTLVGAAGMPNGNANGAAGQSVLAQTAAGPAVLDQTPIPTIEGQAGQQVPHPQPTAAERARRDSTISAGGDDGAATITVDVAGDRLAERTAAEAAAEAAAAIALMGQGRGG